LEDFGTLHLDKIGRDDPNARPCVTAEACSAEVSTRDRSHVHVSELWQTLPFRSERTQTIASARSAEQTSGVKLVYVKDPSLLKGLVVTVNALYSR
jgi:hypothetical protein